MFRPGGMIESSKGEVDMSRHDKGTFCRMMEFIYTGMLISLHNRKVVYHSIESILKFRIDFTFQIIADILSIHIIFYFLFQKNSIGNVSDLSKCDTSAIIFLLEASNEYF